MSWNLASLELAPEECARFRLLERRAVCVGGGVGEGVSSLRVDNLQI